MRSRIFIGLGLITGVFLLSCTSLSNKKANPFVWGIWTGDFLPAIFSEEKEKVVDRSRNPLVNNRAVSHIVDPAIEIYLPEKPCGTALLICPGGGYAYEAFDKEGVDIALWLNQLGITACVLKYRLPGEVPAKGWNIPLADAQRALRTIRAKAAEWHIDTGKIGVIGFSAGGHLASMLGTAWDRSVYEKQDRIDEQSARPDFMILVYPVISMQDGITHKNSRQNLLGKDPSEDQKNLFSSDQQVSGDTPPTLLFHASDDKSVPPENSIRFYRALLENRVSAEMHLFMQGGHGFALRGLEGSVAHWPDCLKEWLGAQGLMK